jgi:hypothetical protein
VGVAMHSLADMYQHGQGVTKDMRHSREWLWRAALLDIPGALGLLDWQCVMVREFLAMHQSLESCQARVAPGQSVSSGGPNLGSLLLALHADLRRLRFQLPRFAAIAPATPGGSAAACAAQGLPLLGQAAILKNLTLMRSFEQANKAIVVSYLRRGCAAEATAQTLGAVERPFDAQAFVPPPPPHPPAGQLHCCRYRSMLIRIGPLLLPGGLHAPARARPG